MVECCSYRGMNKRGMGLREVEVVCGCYELSKLASRMKMLRYFGATLCDVLVTEYRWSEQQRGSGKSQGDQTDPTLLSFHAT